MQPFTVEVKSSAAKFIEKQDAKTRHLISDKIAKIAKDPLDPQHSKWLAAHGDLRSARVGSLRIIFEVDLNARVLRILVVDSRGQVYRRI